MRVVIVSAAGVLLVVLASSLAHHSFWLSALADIFTPYLVIPLLVGVSGDAGAWGPVQRPPDPPDSVVRVAALSASSSVLMIASFYLVDVFNPERGVLTDSILSYGILAVLTGAPLGLIGRRMRYRYVRHTFLAGAVAIAMLTLLEVAVKAVTGLGRLEVETDSGQVIIGYSATDLTIALTVTVAVAFVLLAYVLHDQRRST